MELTAALAYLDDHVNREATAGRVAGLSLEPITRLLEALGDPQTAYPVIHVTGTNGKGSTVAMIGELLAAHGLSVGEYTSPHLVRVNERIARNGEPITDGELAAAITRIAAVEDLTGVRPSYFEILTAAALDWFADVGVDVAVVEVGLLGRWDATNIVNADVAVITNVGRDHTDGSPGWQQAVAAEKAGIIKADSAVVLGATQPALRSIFAAEPSRSMVVRGDDFDLEGDQLAVGGRLVDVRTPRGRIEELFLPVHGTHQGHNASIALTAAETFFDRALDPDVVAEAFGNVKLPGRFEIVGRNPLVVLDGAHNPDGARALAFALRGFTVERTIYVLGMLDGRDIDDVVDALDPAPTDLVVACTAPNPRAVPAIDIARVIEAHGVPADVVADPVEALDAALGAAGDDDAVVVTGSLYVVGTLRPQLVPSDY